MKNESAWRLDFADAVGEVGWKGHRVAGASRHRVPRMVRFAMKHGSPALRKSLAEQSRRKGSGLSRTLRRFVVPTASGKTWKVLASRK